jgi:allophanate hydrolase
MREAGGIRYETESLFAFVQLMEARMKIQLAVVGAHLRGQPLNHQLIEVGAAFVGQTVTAPIYRLFALANTSPLKPGMIRSENGASIEVEIWELAAEKFGLFVAAIPSPFLIGNINLASGEWVKGFLCEEIALCGALEITSFGGWRAFLASL